MNTLHSTFQHNLDGEPDGFHFLCGHCDDRAPVHPDEGVVIQMRRFLEQHQHE